MRRAIRTWLVKAQTTGLLPSPRLRGQSAHRKRCNMYGVIVEVKVNSSREQEALCMLRDVIVPRARLHRPRDKRRLATPLATNQARCCACFRSTESTAPCFIFSAHANGVAHDSASTSTESAPRSNRSVTNSTRPQRHAHPSGVLLSRSSRTSSFAPASRRIVAKPMRSAAPIGADRGQAAATSCSSVRPKR